MVESVQRAESGEVGTKHRQHRAPPSSRVCHVRVMGDAVHCAARYSCAVCTTVGMHSAPDANLAARTHLAGTRTQTSNARACRAFHRGAIISHPVFPASGSVW